jgi:hypothetical protein
MVALGPLTLAGCISQTEGAAESSVDSAVAIKTKNGLSQNGLSQNGLSQNGLSQNGLSQNGLSQNGLIMDALSDPTTGALNQQFLAYVVSCALPATSSINITINNTNVNFYGQLGLAPTWGISDSSPCDDECQEWVSACLIARVNVEGHHIDLSLRGSHPALALATGEAAAYPNAEATYFGNIFSSTPKLFACRMPDSSLINRVCGDSAGDDTYPDCVASVLGTCNSSRCDFHSGGEGEYYDKCHANGQTSTYKSITVYRQPTDEDNPSQ